MENTIQKEKFLKENNIKNLKTLVRVSSDKYKNSGGYYGSSNGWIGQVVLGGYASSSMHEKLKVSFGDGDSWEYYPDELQVLSIEDLKAMDDKQKSFRLLMSSDFIKFKSYYFLWSIASDKLKDWTVEDDILTLEITSPIYDETINISIENKS